MTDEQIKQNAEVYAGNSTKHLQQPYEEYKLRYDAYIAGAHSLDEEIQMLKNQIEELSEQLKMNAKITLKIPIIPMNAKLYD